MSAAWAYGWPILLQALALVVGVAEWVVPSFGLLTVLCLGLLGLSWYLIAVHLPTLAWWAFGAADLALVPVGVRLALRLADALRISHGSSLGSGSGLEAADDWKALEGREATVDSQLRPVGKILLDGRLLEAVAQGGVIEKGETVRILSAAPGRIVVDRSA